MAVCTNNIQCQPLKYCDAIISRCSPCDQVCNLVKGLKSECQKYCPHYLTAKMFTTTANIHATKENDNNNIHLLTGSNTVNHNFIFTTLLLLSLVLFLIVIIMLLSSIYYKKQSACCFNKKIIKNVDYEMGEYLLQGNREHNIIHICESTLDKEQHNQKPILDNYLSKMENSQHRNNNTSDLNNNENFNLKPGENTHLENVVTDEHNNLKVTVDINVHSPTKTNTKNNLPKNEGKINSDIDVPSLHDSEIIVHETKAENSNPGISQNATEQIENSSSNCNHDYTDNQETETDNVRLSIDDLYTTTVKCVDNDLDTEQVRYKETKLSELKEGGKHDIPINSVKIKPMMSEKDKQNVIESINMRIYDSDEETEELDETPLKHSEFTGETPIKTNLEQSNTTRHNDLIHTTKCTLTNNDKEIKSDGSHKHVTKSNEVPASKNTDSDTGYLSEDGALDQKYVGNKLSSRNQLKQTAINKSEITPFSKITQTQQNNFTTAQSKDTGPKPYLNEQSEKSGFKPYLAGQPKQIAIHPYCTVQPNLTEPKPYSPIQSEETVVPPCLTVEPKQVKNKIHSAARRNRPRKELYEMLKDIDWVQGYYSEGKSIIIYTDLTHITQDVAYKELIFRTGESKDLFHLQHEADK